MVGAMMCRTTAKEGPMTVEVDADGQETNALFALVDFNGRHVLEIGSGDGRLTWRYATRAGRATAIEPFRPAHKRAVERLPADLRDRVALRNASFEEFAASSPPASFDIALLSWCL
jgi:cyclopropane fatty-acyl-phospholipid synthase-like methyltransferase